VAFIRENSFPILEIKNLSMAFWGIKAISELSIKFYEGEVSTNPIPLEYEYKETEEKYG